MGPSKKGAALTCGYKTPWSKTSNQKDPQLGSCESLHMATSLLLRRANVSKHSGISEESFKHRYARSVRYVKMILVNGTLLSKRSPDRIVFEHNR